MFRTTRFSLLIGLCLWSFYLRTGVPDVPVGDAGELLIASSLSSSAHPPGYPLWVLLNRLFAWIPLGSFPWRAALLSQTCVALAMAVFANAGWRLCSTGGRVACVIIALFLGTSMRLWQTTSTPEVYGLHLLIVSLLCRCVLIPNARTQRIFALLAGLGMSNHYSTVAMAPLVFIFLQKGSGRGFSHIRPFARWPVLFLLGVTPYLLLPLRAEVSYLPGWTDHRSVQGVMATLRRAPYQETAKPLYVATMALQQGVFVSGVARDLSVPFLILALAGLAMSCGRRPRWAFTMVACFVIAGPVLTGWANVNLEQVKLKILEPFYSPCELILALFALPALSALIQKTSRTLVPLLLLLVAARAGWNLSSSYQRDNFWGQGFIQYVSRSVPRQCGLLGASDQMSFLSAYMLRVEGRGQARAAMTQRVPYWERLLSDRLDPIPLPSLQAAAAIQTTQKEVPVDWVHRRILEESKTVAILWEAQPYCINLWPLLERQQVFLANPTRATLVKEDLWRWLLESGDRLFANTEEMDFFSGVYGNLGAYAWMRGRRSEAMQSWLMAARLSPLSPAVWGNMGASLLSEKKPREARLLLEQAVRLDPWYCDALLNLSLVEKSQGQFSESRKWAKRALLSNPWRPEPRNLLKNLPPLSE